MKEFLTRKASRNEALTRASGLPPSIPACIPIGTSIELDETDLVEECLYDYEWWPMSLYSQHKGDPDQNGHVRLSRKGKAGVAIFAKPMGVSRCGVYNTTSTRRTTCVASTIAQLERFTGEVEMAFSQAMAASKQTQKDIDAARGKVKKECFVDSEIVVFSEHAEGVADRMCTK